MRRPLSLAILIALLPSCTGMTVKPVPNDAADATANGFRYYEPAPYILVHADGAGGVISKLIYLPDTTRKLAAHPYAYLATNQTTLKFADGVLTSSENESDAATVPKAIIEAAKQVATAAAKGSFSTTAGDEPLVLGLRIPLPSLFKLEVNGADSKLIGGTYVGGGTPIELRVNVSAGGDS